MFGKTEVEEVMKWLEKNVPFYASEAQLQMSFVAGAIEKYGTDRFIFIPEYSVVRKKFNDEECGKRDEIDLVIVDTKDKNKKTFIEFKHKTFGYEGDVSKRIPQFAVPLQYKKTIINGVFQPTNMGAVDLGSYDCWSDIERLEYYKNKQDECDNAFFIFITNDERYWNSEATNRNHKYGGFSIANGERGKKSRKWVYNPPYTGNIDPNNPTNTEKNSLGLERIEHTPLDTGDYDHDSEGQPIEFENFGKKVNYVGKINSIDFTQYMKLVLEIK